MKEHSTAGKSGQNKWLIPAGIVLVILGIAGIGAYQAFYNPKPPKILETYGNQTIDSTDAAGKPLTYTLVHQVPDFEFTDQNGNLVSQKTIEGKTYVADFFFTTCKSICPVMSSEMMKLAQNYRNDPDIMFLSHTVDPETDSVAQLKSYALAHQADDTRWKFLTGPKKDLYDMARKGYFATATEGDGGTDDFVHTQNFVLVDKFRKIRGFYDGTDSTEMLKLRRDIDLLKAEYGWLERQGAKE